MCAVHTDVFGLRPVFFRLHKEASHEYQYVTKSLILQQD